MLLFINRNFNFSRMNKNNSSCSNKLEPTIIENVNITQKSNDIQVKLIKELTASLDATLEQSQKVSTPTNAEKVANKLFPDILTIRCLMNDDVKCKLLDILESPLN